jgi:DNA-binding FrmR family transcriptional regulator
MDREQMRKSVLQRLGTIKGHIAGIEKMVQEEKDCETILFQLSAVMGAMNKLSAHILEGYTQVCLDEVNVEDKKARQRIGELTKTMLMMLK